jgi:hypothetical protein
MRYLAILGLLGPCVTQAAPFVVSGPLETRATHCGFAMDGGARSDIVVATSGTDKICKMDLAGLATGSHVVNATAVANDAVYGRLESPPSANFTFAVPTIPVVPSGLKLTP